MKRMALFGCIIGLLAFFASLYVQFVLAPQKAAAMNESYAMLYFEDRALQEALWDTIDFVTNMIYAMLLLASIGVLLNIVPAIKKYKLAWLGLALSLVALVIGLVQGTHIFA